MVHLLHKTQPETPKKKKYNKEEMPSKVINIIRTTQRNNIELTAIADYKANVLLSLNAFILTCIVPYVFSSIELILENKLYYPLLCAAITCFLTIVQAAEVLKPSDFDKNRGQSKRGLKPSPFFFGNFYKMEADEYYDYLSAGMANDNLVKQHLAQDLYYVGRRLGQKMSKIRLAFNIFLFGIFSTLIATAVVLSMN